MNTHEIQNQMELFLDAQISETLKNKPQNRQFLEFHDLQRLGTNIEGMWIEHCGETPAEIKSAILMSQAVLANDFGTKVTIIKHMLSSAGLVTGLGLILSGVGTILGWGAGIITTISTAITGLSLTGPLAIVALGAVASLIAGYLIFSNIPEEVLSRKAIQVLRQGINDALPQVWQTYESKWNNA